MHLRYGYGCKEILLLMERRATVIRLLFCGKIENMKLRPLRLETLEVVDLMSCFRTVSHNLENM